MQRYVALGRRMSDLPLTVEAHPEFRDGLRAMLMATIEREGIGVTAQPDETSLDDLAASEADRLEQRRARRRTRTFGAVVAGLAAGALALSGISAASGDALPGDPLYGFKRSTERAQLALTGSDVGRGQRDLDFAKTRLDEARSVRDADDFDRLLDDMDAETREGVQLLAGTAVDRSDSSQLNLIDDFVVDQRRNLSRLRDDLAASLQQRADVSLNLLDRVAVRSAALRPLLACGSTAVGAPDELGPVPRGRCNADQPTGSGATGPMVTDGSEPAQPAPDTSTAASRTPAPAGGPEPGTTTPTPEPNAPAPTSTPSPSIEGSGLQGNPIDIFGIVPSPAG